MSYSIPPKTFKIECRENSYGDKEYMLSTSSHNIKWEHMTKQRHYAMTLDYTQEWWFLKTSSVKEDLEKYAKDLFNSWAEKEEKSKRARFDRLVKTEYIS